MNNMHRNLRCCLVECALHKNFAHIQCRESGPPFLSVILGRSALEWKARPKSGSASKLKFRSCRSSKIWPWRLECRKRWRWSIWAYQNGALDGGSVDQWSQIRITLIRIRSKEKTGIRIRIEVIRIRNRPCKYHLNWALKIIFFYYPVLVRWNSKKSLVQLSY